MRVTKKIWLPHQEIYQDNNTSINNTFNNTNKEEVETSPVKYSTEHFTLASKLKNNLMNDFPKEMKKPTWKMGRCYPPYGGKG